MIELLVVMAAGAIVLSIATVYSVPMMLQESMRGAIYEVQTFLQLARIEAISRSHDCRFVVDTSTGSLQVLDSMGTATLSDDTVLHQKTLSSVVVFARPDSVPAVTLSPLTGTIFQSVFSQDGTVASGAGDVGMFGGERFRLVSLHAAGGLQIRHWDDGSWLAGS